MGGAKSVSTIAICQLQISLLMKRTLYILTMLMISCTTPVDITESDFIPKMVVGGVFTPGEPVRVLISPERDILSVLVPEDHISGASVALNQNNQEITILVEKRNALDSTIIDPGAYEASGLDATIIEMGSTYEVTISKAGYPNARAMVTIPSVIPVFNVDTSYVTRFGGEFTLNVVILIPEVVSEAYYQLYTVLEFGEYESDSITRLIDTTLPTVESFKLEDHLLDDLLFEDGKIPNDRKVKLRLPLPNVRSLREGPGPTFTMELRNLSEEYFRYLDTSLLQELQSGDPFSQPVNVFSNVEGGLGIVGSYTKSSVEFAVDIE